MIGSKVAMVSVTDRGGPEVAAAARKSLKAAKFEIMVDSRYPISHEAARTGRNDGDGQFEAEEVDRRR